MKLNMKKILMLYSDKESYFFNKINNDEIELCRVFKSEKWIKNKFLSIIRKYRLKYSKFFYDEWFTNLNHYEMIIVFDSPFNYDRCLLSNISKKAQNAVKVLYLWNIVNNEKLINEQLNECKKNNFSIYSYDKENCQKYNLKFNSIMYIQDITLKNNNILFDTIFLGFLKDRNEKLKNLYEIFKKANLKAKIVIVSRPGEEENQLFDYRKKSVKYDEYLDLISKSNSILDITQENQNGFSLRVMESIFLNKKLITTNKDILNSNFYNKNNILVIDIDNIIEKEIIDFFNLPFIEYSDEIKKYYSLEEWIKRFY